MPSVPSEVSPRTPRHPNAALLWAALITVYVVWGSTYFGIAVAIETIPPFLMAAFRFLVAGTMVVAFDLMRHPATRRVPSRRELRDSAIVGCLLLGAGNGLVVLGERTVPSGIAAILIAMSPVWFAVLGWLYFRERLPRLVAFAIAVGFVGVALLVGPEGEGANRFDLLGIVVLFIAPIGWAHGSVFSAKRARLPRSPLTASGLQMLAGAVLLFGVGTITGEWALIQPERISFASIAAVAYLVVFGSMVAFTAYSWLLQNAPLSLVGTYAYVNPIVAVALGSLVLREGISVRTIVASAVILAAVAIIVSARARLATPEATPARSRPPAREPGSRAAIRAATPPTGRSG
jgi:drug/metabolite transporter (DMT)-like permease